ncbi:AbiJ-NTD4 domain-containing protein [Comamonas thiooxydans]|uniref:AbiJ-NTD4 domain-containing protein n=1 Tax=Comamonas thiooxydans TaxID=363952 RepID=UPI00209BDA34|nr:hypothetical protein [Comamonas thiooxydans]MCO8250187.1 hypothetical protein [Comamonas thiooxydans]
MRFSQRIGISSATKIAQRESMDDDLRNSIWSLLIIFYWSNFRRAEYASYGRDDFVEGSNYEKFIKSLWIFYFKKPIDRIEAYWADCLEVLRKYYFNAKWFEVYDFIEFIVKIGDEEIGRRFINSANNCLETENSAYRFVDGCIVEITSAEEIDEVESALVAGEDYSGVKTHLKAAIAMLSDRKNPDYRNSIKESISAVESLAKHLSGNKMATLGATLNVLEKSKKIHPAMKSAFSSLYGYTSDADGIRHALMDEPNLTKADARFMLICCSAFVNYAIDIMGSKSKSES